MTWSAAFPGATACVLRAVVGRRALQVGLLVGGLFVLGFLCGEQAHAADGIGGLPGKTVSRLVKPLAEPEATGTNTARGSSSVPVAPVPVASKPFAPVPVAPKPVTPRPVPPEPAAPESAAPAPGIDVLAHPVDGKVLRPVTEAVVGVVAHHVVEPVGDLVETVTTGLTETVGIPARPTLPAWPTVPSLPQSPSWPTLPTVPSLPTAPGPAGTPGQTLPAPAPVTSAPQQQADEHAATKQPGAKGSADTGAGFGPYAGDGTEPAARFVTHRTTSTAHANSHAPTHQVPSDNPVGALGGKSAVDNGSSRHGDAHAVTPDHRTPPRLVPGAAASVDAAGTRDRYRDIPVFPG